MKGQHRPGGGIASKNVRRVGYRHGTGADAIHPKWPAQVGGSKGNRVQGGSEFSSGNRLPRSGIIAEPYKGPSFDPVKQGNEVAAATVCGPGGSREIHPHGGQQPSMRTPARPVSRPIMKG
jgi:hypothetical protein